MFELHIPPEFVERENELGVLRKAIDEVSRGLGKTIFVIGESGVGKTRLVEEVIEYAEKNGFKIHIGRCLLESLTPMMPMLEALKSAGLEHLLKEERRTRVECVYAVAKSGLILGKYERKENINSDILMGMVVAIENFVKDTVAQLENRSLNMFEISTMGYGSFNIVNMPGKHVNLVAITSGRENESLISDMRELVKKIDEIVGEGINNVCNWDYENERAERIKVLLKNMLLSGKYDGADVAWVEPKVRQASMFENVVKGLVRMCKTNPVLIFIDDIQWADPSSLALLHYISRNTRKDRVLIIGTCRQEDLVLSGGSTHRVVELMQNMNRESLLEVIELKRFNEEECGKLIGSVLGQMPEKRFVSRLYSETEGNALFVIELLKGLYEDGYLGKGYGSEERIKEMRLPSRIYDAISRRLQKLTREERDVIESASIIGEEFTSALTSAISGMNKLQVLRILGSLERVHKLIRAESDKYRFEHSKIREVLCSEMNLELKRYYNEEIAKYFENEYLKGKMDVLIDIVQHYIDANNVEKIIEYGLLAGRFAKNRYANEEAIRILNETLKGVDFRLGKYEKYEKSDRYEDKVSVEKIKLLEEKASILDVLFECNESIGRYNDALLHLEKRYSIIQVIAKNDYERALEGARYNRRKAVISIARGEHEDALRFAEEGLRIVEEYKEDKNKTIMDEGKSRVLDNFDKMLEMEYARLLSSKGFVCERKGDYSKALEYQRRALDIFEKEKSVHDIAKIHHRIGTVYHNLGELEKAEKELEKALKLMEEIGDLKGISGSSNNLGEVYRIRGECDKAMVCYDRALKIDEKIGDRRGLSVVLSSMGDLNLEVRNYSLSVEYYEKSNEICRMIDNKYGLGWNY
ncbi:MAG: tetratricopeptide repeat protein, partial [Thermoplasmata archaeon]